MTIFQTSGLERHPSGKSTVLLIGGVLGVPQLCPSTWSLNLVPQLDPSTWSLNLGLKQDKQDRLRPRMRLRPSLLEWAC